MVQSSLGVYTLNFVSTKLGEPHYVPPRPKHDSRNRHVTCENCEREGFGISTTVLPSSSPVTHMVEFKKLGAWNFDYYCTGFDWRFFGLGNVARCAYPHAHVAENFSRFFARTDVESSSGKRGDLQCLIGTQTAKANNLRRAVWLSERDDYSPVLFEEQYDVAGVPERRTAEVVWQPLAASHMFPKRVKYNSIVSLDGVKMPFEEVTTVEHVDFETPIDPAIFAVAGFGLNENQLIGYPELEHKDQPRWKNGKVDYSETAAKQAASGNAAAPQAVAPYPVESNLSSIIGICAAVMAVVTAVTALVLRRRRNAA